MSSAILQKYRAEILDLAMRHGAGNVRVFGSLSPVSRELRQAVEELLGKE